MSSPSSPENRPNDPYGMLRISAREIANKAIDSYGSPVIAKMPDSLQDEVRDLIISAVHDGIEFGEAIANLPVHGPGNLEHYTEGYMAGLDDRT